MSEPSWPATAATAPLLLCVVCGLMVFAATVVLTGAALVWLRRHAILDRPNERSSHTVPTPRGGGVGLLAPVILAFAALALLQSDRSGLVLPAAAGILGVYCWRDDRAGLPVVQRLAVQTLAVALGLAILPHGLVFQGWLPFWLDRAVAGLGWLWFLNLYNFMDGIDGITGVETVTIGAGFWLLGGAGAPAGSVLVGAGLGFLVWNWQPAKLFMGDVGSVPLGYLIGGLLLSLAAGGAWAPALIVPMYYLADATLTLLWRVYRRQRFWQAHRSHFYQRAVVGGLSHAAVCRRVLICNLGLLALATASRSTAATSGALIAVAVAVLWVAGLLLLLQRAAGRAGRA